jgi:hypothetical protein
MRFGVAYYFVLFAVEIATWWLPYLFGPSPKWLEIYSRIHSQTLTLLPRRGTNPVPNLEHLILQLLTALTASVTLVAYRSVLALPGWLLPATFAAGAILSAWTAATFVGKKG